jgi:hypothetical protein
VLCCRVWHDLPGAPQRSATALAESSNGRPDIRAMNSDKPQLPIHDSRLSFKSSHEAPCSHMPSGPPRATNRACAGAEKKATAKLQEPRTVRKIVHIEDHICLTFSGLQADARSLIDKARLEAQNYKLTFDEPASVEYITKYVAQVQQYYTQGRGLRPFGISTLIIGFDAEGQPQLYQTDPSGIYSAWKANAIGRNAKTVRTLHGGAPSFGEMLASLDVAFPCCKHQAACRGGGTVC